MSHIPVLLNEVLRALNPQDGDKIIDGTFGAGGYSRAILGAAKCDVIGLDRDPNVVTTAEDFANEFGGRFSFVQTEFSKLDEVADQVDGVVLDIGVSSMQLDQGERGFSFMRSGPLDMRMGAGGPSAADAVNSLSHADLLRIFKVYGEEKRARRCADFIVRARTERPIETTDALAGIITEALGKTGKTHPATKVFQALRIYINNELGELYDALLAAEKVLKPGGRLVVVTFHSLEDRIVKSFLRARSDGDVAGSRHLPPQMTSGPSPTFKLKKRSGVSASREEELRNPRSRSARLRSGVKIGTSVWDGAEELLPSVPHIDDLKVRAA